MTTKSPVRRVAQDAAKLRELSESGTDLQIVNLTRTTLREGQDVTILSSDGVGFSGYVYGFEKLSPRGVMTYITLD